VKRPAFQFYPADWRNNAKLRRCSEAARGVWMDILCVLHDSDEYGVCRWPLADLARAAGASLKLVRELAAKDVLKGADADAKPYVYTPRHAGKAGQPVVLVEPQGAPCWYCSRFVRDEWVRLRRGSATQFTDTNQPPKAKPKPPIGERQGDGPTSTSTTSSLRSEEEPRVSRSSAPKPPRPEDVSEQTWADWCQLRKQKKASVTETVILGARKEAAKASLSLEQFLSVWCLRGSQGLEASWLKSDERPGAAESFRTQDERIASERMAELAPGVARRQSPKFNPTFDVEMESTDVTPRALGQ
jgi:hypothetical protein